MIKRATKSKNFTVVDNEFVNDTRLSARAKGVLLWILSKPDDWVISRDSLHSAFAEGRGAIWTAFKELVSLGYVVEIDNSQRTENGQFVSGKKAYIAYDLSIYSDRFYHLYPEAEKPEDQISANGRLQRTEGLLSTDSSIKQKTEYIQRTETKKDPHRFFLFLEEQGLAAATAKTLDGMKRSGEMVSISILPVSLKEELIKNGCKISANKKLYYPSNSE